VGTREGVLQFVRAVSWVDVNQCRSSSRAAHVQHDPLDAVGGPDADAITAADAERPEAAGYPIGGIAELRPGHATRLMTRCDRKAIGKAACGAMEQIADGEIKEGASLSVGVAQGQKVIVFKHGIDLCGNDGV